MQTVNFNIVILGWIISYWSIGSLSRAMHLVASRQWKSSQLQAVRVMASGDLALRHMVGDVASETIESHNDAYDVYVSD